MQSRDLAQLLSIIQPKAELLRALLLKTQQTMEAASWEHEMPTGSPCWAGGQTLGSAQANTHKCVGRPDFLRDTMLNLLTAPGREGGGSS